MTFSYLFQRLVILLEKHVQIETTINAFLRNRSFLNNQVYECLTMSLILFQIKMR